MADTTYTAVDFSELPSADNGKTLIYKDGQVCQSNEDLSSIIGKHTSGYATQEWVNNKLEEDYYDVENTNELLDEKLDVTAFGNVSGTFLTAHQDISYLATKDELSAGVEDAKDYADEGIQEIADGLNDLTNYVETGFSNIEYAIDEKLDTTAFESVSGDFLTSADLSNYYTKSETSGKEEISAALSNKQDTLTAGINLKIDNGIIDIKNIGCSADATSIALGDKSESYGRHTICYGRADEDKPHIASGEYCINLGWHSSAIGNYSTVLGGNYCLASGDIDPNDGKQYLGPIAQGLNTSSVGQYSHAEGCHTFASSYYSHAEGLSSMSLNTGSHAEGQSTSAEGYASHTEGGSTYTKGGQAHAEGYAASAIGYCSHAGGQHTVANYECETVVGSYNILTHDELPTSGKPIFVVGNGNSNNNRSDSFIVTMNGIASATNMYTSAGQVVTDVMLSSATNSSASFVTNGVADLTPLYTYIKSLEDRIAALEAAQGGDGFTVNGVQPTVNGNTITVGE